jgi:dTMP kinase
MVRNHKGLFISIEKTREGLGGTTLASNLVDSLQSRGYDVVFTREPGGTELGKQIRSMLLDPNNKLSKATELFLFLADRAQHYKEVLKPALRDGKIVVCDRYFDSTLAYQGAGRGWKTALLWRLHHATTGSLLPNLTYVLDGEPYVDRAKNNPDRIEGEGTLFSEQVRATMLHLTTKDSRYAVLDANAAASVVAQRALEVIDERKLLELVKK